MSFKTTFLLAQGKVIMSNLGKKTHKIRLPFSQSQIIELPFIHTIALASWDDRLVKSVASFPS